jgi:hypothetical protein
VELRLLRTVAFSPELGPERRILAPQDRDLVAGVSEFAGKARERGSQPLGTLRRSERFPGALD